METMEARFKKIFQDDDVERLKEELGLYLRKDVNDIDNMTETDKERVRSMLLDKYGNGLLHLAAETHTKTTKAIDFLLDQLHFDVNIRNKSGWVPLHNAALSSNVVVLSRLLKARPDTSIKTAKGLTAVELAIKENQIAALSELLDWDCDFLKVKDDDEISPLLSLSAKYLIVDPTNEVLRRINSTLNAELQKRNKEGESLLHIAARSYSLALDAFIVEILNGSQQLLPLRFRLNFDLWDHFISHLDAPDALYQTNIKGQTPLQVMTERPVATILNALADLRPPVISPSHSLLVPFDFQSHEDAVSLLIRVFPATPRVFVTDLIASITILPEISMNPIALIVSHLFSRVLSFNRPSSALV